MQAAMLKFRLPYAPDPSSAHAQTSVPTTTEYLDGDLYLPVWGGRTTTETRLIVTDPVRQPRHCCCDGTERCKSLCVCVYLYVCETFMWMSLCLLFLCFLVWILCRQDYHFLLVIDHGAIDVVWPSVPV